MAVRKVSIELDEDLIRRARDRSTVEGGSDSDVIAATVSAFLGFDALDEAHALGGLPEDEAERVAVDELRAFRAALGNAA